MDENLCEAVEMEAEESGPQVQDAIVDDQPVVASSSAKPMETEHSGFYEWEIRNFAKLDGKQVSETFEVGTYLWKLLCFPKQNQAPYKYVSVFLEYPEAMFTPHNLSPKATFKLTIKNHKDPSKGFFKDSTHTFVPEQVDWGFSQMLPLVDLNTGYLRDDGTLVIRVEITIHRDERFTYDSRHETGFVGLKNQGATCYMNSLLQYLYHVPYFRKCVYHMPVPENEDAAKSLPVALQSLFYRLQYARSAVSTKELTKSFGWTSYDAFMQHDVQELNRVLCEKLEEKMKNTKVEKAINFLFEGLTYNFIECINVSYKSSRKESFMDLQLDVKGCKNVYDSFDKYTEVEVLNGPNQYQTDSFGLQDARKGILFESFPPVLQLQLKRFEYDFQRDAMVKINDRYEFPEELDLDAGDGKYLAPGADRSVRNLYKLHSVLVHSGGVHGGHYYAYIRPDGKTWFKFDDDRVSREDERQAMDAQYGGGGEDDLYGSSPPAGGYGPAPAPGGGLKYAKFSNAYMLVYVRRQDWQTIMCDVTKDNIQKHLLDRLEREMLDKEARHRDKMEAHLYCSLKVASDQDFRDQVGDASYFDLVDHTLLPAKCHYRLRKQTKFSEFKEEVARRTGIPPHRQRFWTWKRRTNTTYRPDRPLTAAEEASQLVDLREIREMGGGAGAKSALMDIRLYLEELPEDPKDLQPVAPVAPRGGIHAATGGHLLLFFKYFDPLKQSLVYVTHHLLSPSLMVKALGEHLVEESEELAAADSADPEAGVLMFEEVKFEPKVMLEALNPNKSLAECEMEHGDIIVFQRALPPDRIAAAGIKYAKADDYLSYIHNRRQVHFKRLEEPQGPPVATLELLRDTQYDQVASALAAALSLPDPSKLRFTKHNYFSSSPMRQPVRYRGAPSLESMLSHSNHPTDTIYFEVLDLPLEEMEQLKTVKVSFHNERGEYVGEQHSLRLRREATVADLLTELAARLQQAAEAAASAPAPGSQGGSTAAAPGSQESAAATAAAEKAAATREALVAAAATAASGRPMRLLEIMSNKIYKVLETTDTLDTLNESYWQLRAEFVPEEQLPSQLGSGDYLLHLAHCLPPHMPPAAAKFLAAREARRKAAAAAAQGTQGSGAAADGKGSSGGAAAEGQTGRGTGGGARPMDADDASDTDAEAGEMEAAEAEGAGSGPLTAEARCGHVAVHRALLEQMPGAAFGDPLLVAVRQNDTMWQLRARIQALLGAPPDEFHRWHLIFVGTRPDNAYPNDADDLTAYFGLHHNKFAPQAAADAAAGGRTGAVLVDPQKLTLVAVHEDTAGPGGARRQPPSSSRYAYEKPVKIYG
ncbi:hypothetical protein GPECTOR_4g877 [Gonium pectorale]|uniref:ubiquitinyl hydrolase 1 n=1 Tax=Gonium pectorale TaxID=33097 RepID=A0A150GY15_GONPE|nr:hypothetical protein GPECTOR_4g877 [Gonium pectorale]|eukprot:KXZ54806.1 hypothetical protein GPECTOR_4g877 [Gonium pectorale]